MSFPQQRKKQRKKVTTNLSQAKQVEGFPDFWIFSDGRLFCTRNGGCGRSARSIPVENVKKAEGYWKSITCRVNNKNGKQYLTAMLSVLDNNGRIIDGSLKNTTIHNLVALSFIGPRPEGEEIDHKNTCGTDNRVSNLIYKTKAANRANSKARGTLPKYVEKYFSKKKARNIFTVRARPSRDDTLQIKETKVFDDEDEAEALRKATEYVQEIGDKKYGEGIYRVF